MRVTLRRVLKMLGFILVSGLLIAFNMATAPFQTILSTQLAALHHDAYNLLLPTLSSQDGLGLNGWWRPHAAWNFTASATDTTLRTKCQLDAIHNVYQTIALPTARFECVVSPYFHPRSFCSPLPFRCRINSIVTLRAKVGVTAQFKLHPDQVIGFISVNKGVYDNTS
jgi:hypothetical protein